MSKPTNDLIRIVAAGGGMYLAASKPTNDLIRIAAAGKGCVLFDLAN